MSNIFKVPLIFSRQAEGGYIVTSPVLPELITEGDTMEEAIANVPDALRAALELYEDPLVPQCTVHGALDNYDSNVLFYYFYPYLQDANPQITTMWKNKMTAFQEQYYPQTVLTPMDTPHFLDDIFTFVEKNVTDSNQLFMQ